MKRPLILGLALTVFAALLATIPSTAMAANGFRNFHASTCQVVSGTATFNTQGQLQNNAVGDLVLWCPIVQESLDGSTVDIIMHGWNASLGGMTASTCNVPTAGGNQICTAQPTISDGVVQVKHLSVNHPLTITAFGYLRLTLKQGSVLFGYQLKAATL